MAIKYALLLIGFLISSSALAEDLSCAVNETEELYAFQDQILSLAKKVHSPEELKEKMARPLRCLVWNFRERQDLLGKYVAGACLQRLMGGPEIKGFKKNRSYEIVMNSLINQQFESKNLLTKSEIADFASGKWVEYVNFCKGSVTESLCSELLPSNESIKGQSEMLGATSMLVLKNAYHHFSGDTKKQVAKQILKLYQETSNDSPLKRRVIDQIYKEINKNEIELRGS